MNRIDAFTVDPARLEREDEVSGQDPELLDEVRNAIKRYVVLPSAHHYVAVVLWIAATHCVPAFDYATRLVVRSAEKRSGKSRLLEIIDATCHRPLRAVNATVPAIFRSLDADTPPTLILDEADTIFGSRKVAEQNEDLRGLLNAGFQRGLPVLRTVGPQHEPKEFPTFAMAAIAGIGQMPDTIEDRAVVVKMRRRKPSEQVQPYRIRRDAPRLHELRERLAVWGMVAVPALQDYYPVLPVEDRAADTWEPLVAVADIAGGSWPKMARDAALALTEEADSTAEDDSINLRLLADIQTIFAGTDRAGVVGQKVEFISSALLCERLAGIEESPWSDWELTPSKLGHRLKEYGVKTGFNTSKTARGYRIEDFQDAFERYLRPKASEGVQGAESRGKVPDAFEITDTFKASEENKASARLPQNINEIHLRTPSDTLPAAEGVSSTNPPPAELTFCDVCGIEASSLAHGLRCSVQGCPGTSYKPEATK